MERHEQIREDMRWRDMDRSGGHEMERHGQIREDMRWRDMDRSGRT